MILFIVPLAAWLYNQAADITTGLVDFLRSIPSYFAPKPTGLSAAYTLPFVGGQCSVIYRVILECFATIDGVEGSYVGQADFNNPGFTGAITGAGFELINTSANGTKTYAWYILTQGGTNKYQITQTGRLDYQSQPTSGRVNIILIQRKDGQADNCGNLPNPNPAPSISDDGLFKPTNTYITDSNDVVNPASIVLAPALPLVLVAAITGGYMAALAAAKAASDALEAVKKIAEGLEALKKLWDKLQEFLDEWEKNRPKKRDITRQTYGQILGDGALDFFAPNSKKVEAIQLDIVVTNIPVGFGKYFGSMSPSRYRYKELGYIAFYSVNQGILETHSIQFKRTTLEIPKLAIGFIYHFGLDNQIKAFAFGTFSIEKT